MFDIWLYLYCTNVLDVFTMVQFRYNTFGSSPLCFLVFQLWQSCRIWICRQRSYVFRELHVYLVRDWEEFEGALSENALNDWIKKKKEIYRRSYTFILSNSCKALAERYCFSLLIHVIFSPSDWACRGPSIQLLVTFFFFFWWTIVGDF